MEGMLARWATKGTGEIRLQEGPGGARGHSRAKTDDAMLAEEEAEEDFLELDVEEDTTYHHAVRNADA